MSEPNWIVTTNCVYGSIAWKNVHMVIIDHSAIKILFIDDHKRNYASEKCRPVDSIDWNLLWDLHCVEKMQYHCHILFPLKCFVSFYLFRCIVGMQDVTARGIDVPMVDLVVQFSSPHKIADYVHRVGRTARAGRSGRATLFLSPNEVEFIRTLESKRIR